MSNSMQETLTLLKRRKGKGITAKELDYMASWPPNHGKTSATLSTLHQRGDITRLTEKREGYKVYVFPEFAKGRTQETQGRALTECSNPECVATEKIMVAALGENKALKRRNAELEAIVQSRGIADRRRNGL